MNKQNQTQEKHPILDTYKGNTIRKDGDKVRIYWKNGDPVITCDSIHAAHIVIDTFDHTQQACTPEQVSRFTQNRYKRLLTDCENVRVQSVSSYTLPIHMWSVWLKYTYKGNEFDLTIAVWQDGNELKPASFSHDWTP